MSSSKRKSAPASRTSSKPGKPQQDDRPPKRQKSASAAETAAAAKPPAVTRLKDEEPLFPRGGGSVLSPLEQKQIQIQAKRDVLFEDEHEPGPDRGSTAHKNAKRFCVFFFLGCVWF